VDEEVCLQRCLKRAELGDRADDKASILAKRLKNYNEQTKPVIELYQKFQKVREIDGNRDAGAVYQDTRKAMLPQVFCMVGPQASGKTTLGAALCERTNMKLLNFNCFVGEQGLSGADDETVTMALIHRLSQEISPTILLEDFPQTEFQAKFFIKNCTTPSRVFVLNCPKDVCQERMISLGQDSPNYQPSTLLSQKIRVYNERSEKLIPFLKDNTNMRVVDTEQNFDIAFAQMCSHVQPTIIHIRGSGSDYAQDLLKKTSHELVNNHGFIDLNSNEIIRLENERKTEFGLEIQQIHNAGKLIDEKVIVKMLRNIIYSGQEGRDKFLISGFPGSSEQVKEFETKCANITAIIYTTQEKDELHPTVEVQKNSLISMNIDALFQKQFRLKTLKEWDIRTFEEHLGQKVDWGLVTGRAGAGKTTVAKQIATFTKGKIINMNDIAEVVKGRLGSEDEPFEGDVPAEEVEKDVKAIIAADQANQQSFTYIFDGIFHKEPKDFFAWLEESIGLAKFWLPLQCKTVAIEERYKAKEEGNEVTEELQEEFAEQLKESEEQSRKVRDIVEETFGKVEIIGDVESDVSLETTVARLRTQFCAKVVIVNHEKRLAVDTSCCNLAIKYNMLYLSVYQLIKQHIEDETPQGKALIASRKPKTLSIGVSGIKDDFNEAEYSAVHFDLHLVIDLIRNTIAAKRTNQKYILLEGLCNSNKLDSEEDRLELRFMDEFFMIEKNIGEVCGVIGLQFNAEPTQFVEDKWEEFPEPVVEVVKPKVEGDEDEEDEPAAAEEDDEEKKVPAFKPEDYKWSVTNGHSKNLPQLFRDYKGINCHMDEKPSD